MRCGRSRELRPAFGTELWPIHEHVLQELQDHPPDQYYDLRAEGLIDFDIEEPVDQVPLFESDDGQDVHISEAPAEAAPGPPSSNESDRTNLSPSVPAPSTRQPGTPVGQVWSAPEFKGPRLQSFEDDTDQNAEPPGSPLLGPGTPVPTPDELEAAGVESQPRDVLILGV